MTAVLFVFMRGEYKRAIIGPPAKRHFMAFRWRADDGPLLLDGSFVIVQGIRTSIAKKPYIFVIFQWGVGGVQSPCPTRLIRE